MRSSVFSYLSATAMAANSALFLFGRDFMSMCVMEFVVGFTTPTPRVGLPLTREPSV